MILKYLTKFASDILPSVAATVIGAYVVNHYIISKPADPPVAATASTALPKKADDAAPEAAAKSDPRPDSAASDAGAIKSKSEKPAEKAAVDKAEKSPEKPSVADKRPHQPTRDKAVAKAPPEAAPQDERRDANELARAAIERLRASKDASAEARAADTPREQPRAIEQPRPPEPPRVATAAPMQPLPPAINVAPRDAEPVDVGTATAASPGYSGPAAAVRYDDSLRLSPPAEIPGARPIDLQARSSIHNSVTEDVLSAAKSVFHAVVPR
jgi:hypothetical protein